jgi:hypothetical protein
LTASKGADWLNGDRWKDEQLEGKAAVRLVAGTSYARLEVAGAIEWEHVWFSYFAREGAGTVADDPCCSVHVESVVVKRRQPRKDRACRRRWQ